MEIVVDFSGGKDSTAMLAYLRERDLPLHPVYQHLRRFSCRVCIYMTDHDLRAVAQHDPESIDLVERVEQEIGFTMFQRGDIRNLSTMIGPSETQPG